MYWVTFHSWKGDNLEKKLYFNPTLYSKKKDEFKLDSVMHEVGRFLNALKFHYSIKGKRELAHLNDIETVR